MAGFRDRMRNLINLIINTTRMTVKDQIKHHIASLPAPKASEVKELHKRMLALVPGVKLWFDNGKNEENKTVTNPTIGYGLQTLKYANGKTREFFQVGISTNTTGISVYLLGIKDKTYLSKTYGKKLGKASITGYCIKFKTMNDINLDVLDEAIVYVMNATSAKPAS